MTIPKITLEQWAALKSVVEEKSFAKAAEALNKSQSTVSYAINRLNDVLPAPAMVIKGRKAELTDLGQVLYRRACVLLDQAQGMEDCAKHLAKGWESEITLVTDALTPMSTVFQSLYRFSETCPQTRIKVLETSLSGTDEALFNRQCELALAPRVPTGFLGDPVTTIEMIPVAHKAHPLAQMATISAEELRQYRQIVVRDTGVKREQDAGWLGAEQRWTVSHFASSVEAVMAGLAFAFIPKHRILNELASNELVHLPLTFGRERKIPLNIILSQPQQAGPATLALVKVFKEVFPECANKI